VTADYSKLRQTYNICVKASRSQDLLLCDPIQHWHPSKECVGKLGQRYNGIALPLARSVETLPFRAKELTRVSMMQSYITNYDKTDAEAKKSRNA